MAAGRQDMKTVGSDWEAFSARLDAAEVEFAHGRPDEFKSLWSHTDEVTLCGGLGGAVEVGWENVARRLDWASSKYAEGKRGREEYSRQVNGDFAYLVQKEFIEARIGSQTEPSKNALRVTMIFRRGDDGWRIHHRHADSQTDLVDPQ